MSDITVFIADLDDHTLTDINDAGAAIDAMFGRVDNDITATLQLLRGISQLLVVNVDDSQLKGVTDEVGALSESMDLLSTSGGAQTYASDDTDASDNSSQADDAGTGGGALMPTDSLDDQMAGMSEMLDMLGAITDAMQQVSDLITQIPDEMQSVADTVDHIAGTFDALTETVENNMLKLKDLSREAKEGKDSFKEYAERLDQFNHFVEAGKNLQEAWKAVKILLTAAEVTETEATVAETAATEALDVALMATPWGLIAGVVGGLAVAFMGLKDSTKDIKIPDVKGKELSDAELKDTSHNELIHDKIHYADDDKTTPGFHPYTPVADNMPHGVIVDVYAGMSNSDHSHSSESGHTTTNTESAVQTKKIKEKKTKKETHSSSSHEEHSSQQRVVNINYNSPLYKVDHQSFATIKDAIDEFEPKVKEAMLRILASVPGLQ